LILVYFSKGDVELVDTKARMRSKFHFEERFNELKENCLSIKSGKGCQLI
jgi:hypothetical protein